MRTPISKKLRFEIFKRDLFCCQYCGKTPPSAILEVDHIVPVVSGGKNEVDNLLTSCFDCNRGKGKHELNTLPESTSQKTAVLKEKEEQYVEYQKIQLQVEHRITEEIYLINGLYNYYFPDHYLDKGFANGSVRNFLKELGYNEVYDSMTKACAKINHKHYVIKYFCGICWNKIKNK